MSSPGDLPQTHTDEKNLSGDERVSADASEQVQASPPDGDIQLAPRTVAFPDAANDQGIEEKPTGGLNRPRGVEMRREMTVEERDLAQAGYDHLDDHKAAGAGGRDDQDMDKVDIEEHKYKFDELENALLTSFDTKDPVQSRGLEPAEAAQRLVRDGRNVLTPPKKKGAFRRASLSWTHIR